MRARELSAEIDGVENRLAPWRAIGDRDRAQGSDLRREPPGRDLGLER
jgi:hypothetical protein